MDDQQRAGPLRRPRRIWVSSPMGQSVRVWAGVVQHGAQERAVSGRRPEAEEAGGRRRGLACGAEGAKRVAHYLVEENSTARQVWSEHWGRVGRRWRRQRKQRPVVAGRKAGRQAGKQAGRRASRQRRLPISTARRLASRLAVWAWEKTGHVAGVQSLALSPRGCRLPGG